MNARHTTAHAEHFERHGWVLIDRLLTEAEIDAAYPGLFRLYPTPEQFHAGGDPRAEVFLRGADEPANQGTEGRFRPQQFVGLKEFPFADQTLNLLPVHPAVIAVAESLLRTRDVRLYQAETFAKYTGVTQFLYLSDVTLPHGATRIVSKTLTADVPVMKLSFPRVRVDAERYAQWEAAAVSAVGPRGSLLCYGADVVHRGVEMTQPHGGRFFFNLAYRSAGADWVGANPWPRKGMVDWTPLVERASVRQLEVLGFPPPGHDYWDEETLRGCAERYPKLDLTPWRSALRTSSEPR